MALLDLFIAASIPVLKVLLITALGSFLALDRISILGADSRKHLNNIVFFVFNPALVSSNLAKTVTYQSMVQLWFMPFNILITFIAGSLLGWMLIQITRTPQHLRGLVLGCCAAGNLGNMLLIIIPAICKESGSPFGAPDVCHSFGMAYASLSMAIGAIFLWSYVYNILRISSSKSSKEVEINDSSVDKTPSLNASYTEPLLHSSDEAMQVSKDQLPLVVSPSSRFEHKPQVVLYENPQDSLFSKIMHHAEALAKKLNLKRLLAPSTAGAMVGFAIGLVPFFRNSIIGERAPLRVIQDTALLLGDGAIPSLTLIMGGNLLKGLQGSETPKSIILGIIAVRYIGLPVIGIGVVKLALKFGVVHNNPLYQFVLLLQFALPPAMNIGTMTQLFGAGESECSVIMLWSYALASVALTFWSTFFLWLVA
ncbi:OLC1v1016188C1 [Oldenlandia corymbosa var. corymbosa]|uniref:OLC1v1016188C1 n=1 Tax=Oldenlandia corymbosa var. corymbosa TaxID=529605 RepID=A0AAV1E551_OLDCO|nr:OLC1v1016188C1 [Oldenlandia corymbosa var. corymbosa]